MADFNDNEQCLLIPKKEEEYIDYDHDDDTARNSNRFINDIKKEDINEMEIVACINPKAEFDECGDAIVKFDNIDIGEDDLVAATDDLKDEQDDSSDDEISVDDEAFVDPSVIYNEEEHDGIEDYDEFMERKRVTEELLINLIDNNRLEDLYQWLLKNPNYDNRRVMIHQMPAKYWENRPENFAPAARIRTFLKMGGDKIWKSINAFEMSYIIDWGRKCKQTDFFMQHPLTGNTIFHENLSLVNAFDNVPESVLAMTNYDGQLPEHLNPYDDDELRADILESEEKIYQILAEDAAQDRQRLIDDRKILELSLEVESARQQQKNYD